MLQEHLWRWLGRTDQGVRSVRVLQFPHCAVATDIGLKRSENQDRVAMLRFNPPSGSGESLIVIALSDGMGGMRDGSQCAALAISAFFMGVLSSSTLSLRECLLRATHYADRQVHQFADGKGGATLTAVVFGASGSPLIVNVGDSRAYAVVRDESGPRTKRLTVDDSMEEAFGGHGRDLLQFIGIGEGLSPHILDMPSEADSIILTSDGAHSVNQDAFEDIIVNGADEKQRVERLLAFARWCGGRDNISLAALNVRDFEKRTFSGFGFVEVLDPYESLRIMVSQDFGNREDASRNIMKSPSAKSSNPTPSKRGATGKKTRLARKEKSSSGKIETTKPAPQLEIEIISADEDGEKK